MDKKKLIEYTAWLMDYMQFGTATSHDKKFMKIIVRKFMESHPNFFDEPEPVSLSNEELTKKLTDFIQDQTMAKGQPLIDILRAFDRAYPEYFAGFLGKQLESEGTLSQTGSFLITYKITGL